MPAEIRLHNLDRRHSAAQHVESNEGGQHKYAEVDGEQNSEIFSDDSNISGSRESRRKSAQLVRTFL